MSKEFWDYCKRAKREVDSWPAWKRAICDPSFWHSVADKETKMTKETQTVYVVLSHSFFGKTQVIEVFEDETAAKAAKARLVIDAVKSIVNADDINLADDEEALSTEMAIFRTHYSVVEKEMK